MANSHPPVRRDGYFPNACRPSTSSKRSNLMGRLAARRHCQQNGSTNSSHHHDLTGSSTPSTRRFDHLRRRIQSRQQRRNSQTNIEYHKIHSSDTAYNLQGLEDGAKDGATPDVPQQDEVVLNFQNMDKDCGLRPVAGSPEDFKSPTSDVPARRLAAGHTRLTADEKGQLRYFGYSSLLRMVSVLPAPSPPKSEISEALAVEIEAMADSELTQLRLIDLFFTYQHAAHPVLDEQSFRDSYKSGKRSEYYSEFLLNSVLLRAVKFDDHPDTEQLRDVYMRRARADLLHEIENPSISTIPALTLFGSCLAGQGSDRACWVYPGLAFRLLYDFGLHEDCLDLVEAGLLTDRDRRIRHSILYHCYVFDKLYSSFQGRPTAVPLESFACPLPSQDFLGPGYGLTAAWVTLASILEDILVVINGKEDFAYSESSVEKLSRVSERLVQWFKSLPAELQWTADSVQTPTPAICAIHVQFLSITILLNRPFAAYIPRNSHHDKRMGASKRRCLEGHSPELSQKLCTSSGIRIAKLLLAYRLRHGAAKFFSTINPACLSAAMALISDIVSADSEQSKAEEKKWLKCILETLREITPTYPVAGRSYMTLCAIVNTCNITDVAPARNAQQQHPSHEPSTSDTSGHFGDLRAGIDDVLWNFDGSFTWDYPTFDVDEVHGIGLQDFYPRLSPWPTHQDGDDGFEGLALSDYAGSGGGPSR